MHVHVHVQVHVSVCMCAYACLCACVREDRERKKAKEREREGGREGGRERERERLRVHTWYLQEVGCGGRVVVSNIFEGVDCHVLYQMQRHYIFQAARVWQGETACAVSGVLACSNAHCVYSGCIFRVMHTSAGHVCIFDDKRKWLHWNG